MSRLWIVLGAALCSGCGSFLLPFDERPLPAPQGVETLSGERLDLDQEGQIVVRPERGDLALALGVGLAEEQGGVVVTHRLRPQAGLRPGDRILAVWARVPPATGVAREFMHSARGALDTSRGRPSTSLDAALEESSVLSLSGAALDQTPRNTVVAPSRSEPAPVDSATLRARGQAVRSLEDLRGYATAAGWLTLDLLVEREGQERCVRVDLELDVSPVLARPWAPSRTRYQGVEVVAVSELEPGLRPLHAADDQLLVSRVARDAPLGRAGLRPLDLVRVEELERLLAGAPGEVIKPDGVRRELQAEPRGVPLEVWIPLVFTYQDDGARTHVGLGPWDTTFHYSQRTDYEPTLDAYVERWRWSVGTSIQNSGVTSATGTVRSGGVTLLVDRVRMDYLLDLWNAEREARTRGAGVDP
ncbi:MAG: hypothetical protein R3F62_23590 [Planctomycetota bacterium]